VKTKLDKILVVILVVWFLVFLTDMILFYCGSGPIFMIQSHGGEITVNIGLGYMINQIYPLTTIDDPIQSYHVIIVWPYIVINAFLVLFLVFRKIRRHKMKQTEK